MMVRVVTPYRHAADAVVMAPDTKSGATSEKSMAAEDRRRHGDESCAKGHVE